MEWMVLIEVDASGYMARYLSTLAAAARRVSMVGLSTSAYLSRALMSLTPAITMLTSSWSGVKLSMSACRAASTTESIHWHCSWPGCCVILSTLESRLKSG